MQSVYRELPFSDFWATIRKPWHAPCEMLSIRACCRWFASAMRRLSSLLRLSALSRRAARRRTASPSGLSSGNWRRLTSTSTDPGRRYLLRHATTDLAFSVFIYDTFTTLCWRCDFRTQLERNTYIQNLRSGQPSAWPQALISAVTPCPGEPQR